VKKISPAFPVLLSTRLQLRPFTVDDCAEVNRLVGDKDVATPLIAVDYPYTEDKARRWIVKHAPSYDAGGALNFAVDERDSGVLVGFIGIGGNDSQAGMGYWYGKQFWGRGYATEAGCATIAFAFEELAIEQIAASHLTGNRASGRVLQKMGMRYQGRRPHYYPKWDQYCDKDEYAITGADYLRAREEKPEYYRYRRIVSDCGDGR